MAALWNTFDGAVRVLVGAGPVKQRLIDAWRDHLAPLHEKDIPEGLRSRLAAVHTAMHAAHATGGMTAPEASVRKMSDKDAAEHAERILEMYAQLCAMTELDAAPRLRVVGGEEHSRAEDLPAFLSRA
ncbi:MAG TPA: hypothetical protein VFI92_12435 [Steroidobacteraceae bacterium]|nr:hypothetical protein [Steroidobacteraceae bacterium]